MVGFLLQFATVDDHLVHTARSRFAVPNCIHARVRGVKEKVTAHHPHAKNSIILRVTAKGHVSTHDHDGLQTGINMSSGHVAGPAQSKSLEDVEGSVDTDDCSSMGGIPRAAIVEGIGRIGRIAWCQLICAGVPVRKARRDAFHMGRFCFSQEGARAVFVFCHISRVDEGGSCPGVFRLHHVPFHAKRFHNRMHLCLVAACRAPSPQYNPYLVTGLMNKRHRGHGRCRHDHITIGVRDACWRDSFHMCSRIPGR